MAARSSRRWYQFSVRALLVLMVVVSVPLGIRAGYQAYRRAQRQAEIEANFLWLESLEFPELPKGKPVRVTTKSWRGEDASQAETSEVSFGFLLREDAQSFTVLTPRLDSETYQRKSRETWASSDSAFEFTDLPTVARQTLESAHAKDGQWLNRFGVKLNERGEQFVLAWACWQQGYRTWAMRLYVDAESQVDNRDKAAASFRERLAADFAYQETWQATEDCGTQFFPRKELLAKFRRLQRHFPNSEYAQHVAEKVAMFESMVAEDERHARERAKGPPLAELPHSEQIAELIFQLRDQNGQQLSQPGWCSVLGWFDRGEGDSPGHKLVAFGYEAIPQLAAALSDQRLTRSVGYERNFYFSHHVLTIGEAADQILDRITARRFETEKEYDTPAARIADVQKNALAWHTEILAKGERQCLVEAVERADRQSVSLAERLIDRYPDAGCSAILTALSKLQDEYKVHNLIELLGRVSSDESAMYLLETLEHEKCGMRLAAAEALTALGRPEGIEAMLEQWTSDRIVVEFGSVGPFLAKCGRPAALVAVAKRFGDLSIEAKMDTLNAAMELSSDTLAARPELRPALIELLLVALRDTEERTGMHIGYGNKRQISNPRVCDIAGHHLSELDTTAFAFDVGAPLPQRDAARLAILAKHARPSAD